MKRLSSMWLAVLVVVAAINLNSCKSNSADSAYNSANHADKASKSKLAWPAPKVTMPAGTLLSVRLDSDISSKTAHEGDAWNGVLTRPTFVTGKEALPEGAE